MPTGSEHGGLERDTLHNLPRIPETPLGPGPYQVKKNGHVVALVSSGDPSIHGGVNVFALNKHKIWDHAGYFEPGQGYLGDGFEVQVARSTSHGITEDPSDSIENITLVWSEHEPGEIPANDFVLLRPLSKKHSTL